MTSQTTQQPMFSNQQTLQQARTRAAFEAVGKDISDKYATVVRRLPAMILSEGLANTLLFLKAKGRDELKAKGRDEHQRALQHLSSWVCGRIAGDENADLLTWIAQASTMDYRRATAEAISYATVLKRMAEASGKGDLTGDEN